MLVQEYAAQLGEPAVTIDEPAIILDQLEDPPDSSCSHLAARLCAYELAPAGPDALTRSPLTRRAFALPRRSLGGDGVDTDEHEGDEDGEPDQGRRVRNVGVTALSLRGHACSLSAAGLAS